MAVTDAFVTKMVSCFFFWLMYLAVFAWSRNHLGRELSIWEPKLQEAGTGVPCFIETFTLLWSSGTKPMTSLRNACVSFWPESWTENSHQLLRFLKFSSYSTTHLYSACLMAHARDFPKTFTFLPPTEPASVCKRGKMGIFWAK